MGALDNVKKIIALDRGRMSGLLYALPEQVLAGWRIGRAARLEVPREITGIAVAGLGGSAIGGDLIRSYLADELAVPFIVNRSYTLPACIDSSFLCLASSYSGDTEETLCAYEEARRRGCMLVCLASGGELARRAEADRVPLVRLPSGLPPRAALGFSASIILGILCNLGLAGEKNDEVKETAALLAELREEYRIEVPPAANEAKRYAVELFHTIPVVYAAHDRLAAVAARWKGQLCENSKTLAFYNLFPELNHNEIVGWEFPESYLKKFSIVFLRDRDDHPQVRRRIEITRDILAPKVENVLEIWSRGQSNLARIFSLVYLGDHISFYLAVLNGVDPTPVKVIEFLKERLKKMKGEREEEIRAQAARGH